jgi:glycosyltransferase involved in cell wall biosynthesis
MDKPRVALVIATYNRARPLRRLLTYVQEQNLPRTEFELVVAVDGSTDESITVLQEYQRRADFQLDFFWQENAGPASARHAAILRTRADRIVVVDDDMELHPSFLYEHIQAATADEARTIVIGKIIPEQGWQKKPLFEAAREHKMLWWHQRFESESLRPSCAAFATGNVSFSRKMYLEVGGFDVDLRLDEDRELGHCLDRAGGRFVFAPKAWAIHRSDVGSYRTWERRQYDYGKLAVRVWEKHNKDPLLHPLRNYVAGNWLNRTAVRLLLRSDFMVRYGTLGLRALGGVLQKAQLFGPAIATHKAISALQYHLGVKHTLGCWRALAKAAQEYADHPGRPLGPTGIGRHSYR